MLTNDHNGSTCVASTHPIILSHYSTGSRENIHVVLETNYVHLASLVQFLKVSKTSLVGGYIQSSKYIEVLRYAHHINVFIAKLSIIQF